MSGGRKCPHGAHRGVRLGRHRGIVRQPLRLLLSSAAASLHIDASLNKQKAFDGSPSLMF